METKRTKIGFTFYQEQETEITTEELNPMQVINNQETQPTNNERTLSITSAHKETIERLEMVKMAIAGKKFASMSDEKKQELINELTYLTAVNIQLTLSY